ncbi:site-specific integrase [Asticcacaulis sp. BYS171W]|uniref:Site-specific integrase n=1 Tax=Asticcacaulis aquaticus TaxID=2984212 RepID=A0ABT5HWR8_9CAUL|nr:site-specific integrase [Asticcacaulis aquaticus]MDC7684521.1 site-specific integrase [Asticcacaulis aquaticus]
MQPDSTSKASRAVTWSKMQPGFGLREYTSGRRVYIVECPTPTGRRTITIGNASIISERDALDIARRCIYYSDPDGNLADSRLHARRTPLFQDYLQDYWLVARPLWKPSTQVTEDRYRRLYLNDAFIGMGVEEITRQDVVRWLGAATRKGSPGAANRVFQRLKAALSKAEDWGLRPHGSNPCRGVKMNPRRKVGRYLSKAEFKRLGQAMEKHREEYPIQTKALQVLMLTGCRREEIVGLTWGEVRGARILLDDSKTGPRTVQLCSQASAILRSLKRGIALTPVFNRGDGRPVPMETYWDLVRRDAALGRFRLHDLRHTYASLAARHTLPLPTIQCLLGHSKMASTARYTHFDDLKLTSIAQQISDLIG